LNFATNSFCPDAFADRLREIRKATGLTGGKIALCGGVTKQTFSGYLHTGRLPSANVLANWVTKLGLNANWLLTGQGPMFLEQLGQNQHCAAGEAAELPECADAPRVPAAAAVD
jgi:transcriptional regulator with XRE-family HTH domain